MPIRDLTKFQNLEVELEELKALGYLRPFLDFLGPEGSELANSISQHLESELSEFEAKFVRLREAPDRFNQAFSESGWIAHRNMSTEAMWRAIEIKEKEGLEAAESYLEEYYNDELDGMLRLFLFPPSLEPRRDLIQLAWEDHKAGRYHASVPVVLAQIDGITHDLKSKSFFKKRVKQAKHLVLEETIAGDPTGLVALAAQMSKTRTKTSSSPIALPYRHGILHGRDLGYASRRNSTKAFAALVALRSLVLRRYQEKWSEESV